MKVSCLKCRRMDRISNDLNVGAYDMVSYAEQDCTAKLNTTQHFTN